MGDVNGAAWLAPCRLARVTVLNCAKRGHAGVAVPGPLLAHLMLASPTGRVPTVSGRVLVGAGYASAAVVSVGRAVFYDPFLDRFCWRNCTDNSFLLHADPQLARALGDVGLRASAVLGAAIATVATWRLARATAVGRSALWYALAPAAAAALAEAAYAVVLLRDPAESPEREPFMTLFVVRGGALTLLAFGLTWTMLHNQQRRTAVARLADELGAAPPLGSLRAALAHVLRDDRVEVGYWLPDARRHVDASGRPFEPQPGRDQAVTSFRRGGHPVAVVIHDRALYDDQRLEREIGSAARLAIDNERLRAAMLTKLDDLRASRARIVETGDEARRRIERDLHDGAQQRLLAVTYQLRLAQADATAAGDYALASALGGAVDQAQAALAELREIAHGIFPTILDEAGLGPALWTLADRAEIPVEVGDLPDERLPHGVERAAYLIVTEAVKAATSHDQAELSVRIDRTPGTLVVTVEGRPEEPYDHIADRVGALGGRLTIERHRLRAEIPCD